MLGNELRHRPSRLHPRSPYAALPTRRGDEAASHEILQSIGLPDRGQAGDRSPTARDEHLRAALNLLQVLAQTIVERAHADLIGSRM